MLRKEIGQLEEEAEDRYLGRSVFDVSQSLSYWVKSLGFHGSVLEISFDILKRTIREEAGVGIEILFRKGSLVAEGSKSL